MINEHPAGMALTPWAVIVLAAPSQYTARLVTGVPRLAR
jgi:hypothetical protein